MHVVVSCPCGRRYRVEDTGDRRTFTCRHCGKKIRLPERKQDSEDSDAFASFDLAAAERNSPAIPDSSDTSDEDSDYVPTKTKGKKRAKTKSSKANQPDVTILRVFVALLTIAFFVLEAVIFIYVVGDGQMPKPVQPGQPPPPEQMVYSLVMYVSGLVALALLRTSPGIGWADAAIDTSNLGCAFWFIFVCCPGPGLVVPVLLALLIVSYVTHMRYG